MALDGDIMKLKSLLLSLLLASLPILAGIVSYDYTEDSAPTVEIINGEATVSVRGADFRIHGEPDLPGRSIRIALPPGTEAEDVRFTVDRQILAGPVIVRNTILSEFDNPWTKSAPIASDGMPPAQLDGTSRLHGVPLAEIFVRPVTYDPASGELAWNRNISIDVITKSGGHESFKFDRLTPVSSGIRDRILTSAVVNPEDLPPRPRPLDLSELVYPRRTIPPARGDDKCDGLVIVEDRYLDQLQALKDEINFGLIMEIVPVSQVVSAFPSGSDKAERVRRFIKSAHDEWGISGVFLVGSVEEIPVRLRRGYSPNTPNFMNIPSDMYFSALEGDWNSNGDAYFGDSDDDDFAPDIIVGRFQPEDSAEVTAYLEKINYHRWEIDFDFAKKWMFIGASIQGTDHMGPKECDSIITAGPIPEDVDIQKVYAFADTTGGDVELTESNVLSAIADGRYIIFHFDHGFRYILHTGKHTDRGSGIDIPQFLSMTNAPYTPFLYSYSCEVSAFDVGCVGSASVRAKNGGLIAILAHSKSAYSNHKGLVHHFWHDNFLTRGNSVKLGEAIQGTQIDLGITTTGKYYKTIMNLLGYPFLDMYLGAPNIIDVRPFSASLTSRDTLLQLEAMYMSTSEPFKFGTVVAHDGDGKYAITQTDESGYASLRLRLAESERIILTVSGNGAFPWTDTLEIESAPTEQVVINKSIFYPGGGDHDIAPEPGDTFACALILHNIGTLPAESIMIDIECPGMIEAITLCPPIEPAEYCTIATAFGLIIDQRLRGYQNLRPIVTITTPNHTEIETLALGIYGPFFEQTTTFYTDDNDNEPQAGEEGVLAIGIANTGPGDFRGGVARILLTGATTSTPIIDLDDLPSKSQDTLYIPLSIESHYLIADLYLEFSNTTPESLHIIYSKPAPPESLSMFPGEDEVILRWSPPEDSSVIGYNIYRGDSIAENYIKVNQLPVSSATLSDTDLPQRTRFHYYVTSLDEWFNESQTSDTILAWTTLPMIEPWPMQIGLSREIYSSLALDDIDGDGRMEIYAVGKKYSAVWGFYDDGIPIIEGDDVTDPFRIVSMSDENPSEMGMWSSPAIGAKIDGESYLLVNDRTSPGKAYLINALTAEDAPGWPKTAGSTSMGTPVFADLNGDGVPEVLNPHHNGLDVWLLDGTSYIADAEGAFARLEEGMTGPLWGSPSAGDIDGDGNVEIVMGMGKDSAGNGTIYAFDYLGNILPGWPMRLRNTDFSNVNPILANFDSDTSTLEILVSAYRGGTYIFSHEGDSLPGWPIADYTMLFYESHNAVADFDGDGNCEAVLAGINHLGIHYADGTPLPGWPIRIPESGATVGNPTIGDLSGDGEWDIAVSMGAKIHAFDIYGNSIPGYPLVLPDLCPGAPTLCDLDGDDRLDIVAGGMDSYIYAWSAGVPYSEETIAWPTEKGNFHRTGLYGEHWRIMPVEEGHASPAKPAQFAISAYPNPFNSAVTISLDFGSESPKPLSTIEIFDVNGRRVAQLPVGEGLKPSRSLTGRQTGGSETTPLRNAQFVWQPDESLGSGVYLVRARFGEKTASMRIVYLK